MGCCRSTDSLPPAEDLLPAFLSSVTLRLPGAIFRPPEGDVETGARRQDIGATTAPPEAYAKMPSVTDNRSLPALLRNTADRRIVQENTAKRKRMTNASENRGTRSGHGNGRMRHFPADRSIA